MIKKLIKKVDLVKYCYEVNRMSSKPLWNVDYLADNIDKSYFLNHFASGMYDLKHGIYFYKSVRNQFKLIAKLTDAGVKYY